MLKEVISRYRQDAEDFRWLRPYVLAFGIAMVVIGLCARFDLLGLGV